MHITRRFSIPANQKQYRAKSLRTGVSKLQYILILAVSIFCASTSNGQATAVVCENYPAIRDNFGPDKQNYFSYHVETYICSSDDRKLASLELIYSMFIKDIRNVLPTITIAPVSNCEKIITNIKAVSVDKSLFGEYLPADEPMATLLDKNKHSVTSYTLADNRLHEGKVVRSIIQRGKIFFLVTDGTGNSASAMATKTNANKTAMTALWETIDNIFQREMIEKLSSMEKAAAQYGTWDGRITYGKQKAQPGTLTFSAAPEPDSILLLITSTKNGIKSTEKLKGSMLGYASRFPYQVPSIVNQGKVCTGFLFFQIQQGKMEGGFGTNDANCLEINYVAAKGGLPAEEVVERTEPKKIDFRIDPKSVTLSSDKVFKWYNWNQAPEALKNAARYIHTYKNTSTNEDVTLADQIAGFLNDKADVQIAAVDLDGNGVSGLAVYAEGSVWCGTGGCHFGLYDNGGLSIVDLSTDRDPLPAKSGVLSASKRFFPLRENTQISPDRAEMTRLFSYEKSKIIPPLPSGKLLGGTTPFELGRLLLKAFQTNDRQLWSSCIHPATSDEFKRALMMRFDEWRQDFTGSGVENWKLTTFSRAGFEAKTEGGEKIADSFAFEFYYNNREFIGTLMLCRASTYKGKNYFIEVPCFAGVKFRRNIAR